MKLCTFEVSTQLGKFRRLGVVTAGGVVDLNFAAAHHLGNQTHADALVPASLRGWLEGGALARKTAQEALDYLPEELHRDRMARRCVIHSTRFICSLPCPTRARCAISTPLRRM